MTAPAMTQSDALVKRTLAWLRECVEGGDHPRELSCDELKHLADCIDSLTTRPAAAERERDEWRSRAEYFEGLCGRETAAASSPLPPAAGELGDLVEQILRASRSAEEAKSNVLYMPREDAVKLALALRAAEEEKRRLKEALEPFAQLEMPHQEPDHWPAFGKRAGEGWPTVGDFRRARDILASGGNDGR